MNMKNILIFVIAYKKVWMDEWLIGWVGLGVR